MFSILFQIGPVHKPFIQRYDGCLMVGLGFVIVGFFANSFSGMLNCWHDLAMACANRKQKQMIEEGNQQHVDVNVLLERLRAETWKHREDD